MKNIILAAGYATRLYPLTENFPKPLLTIGSTTILDRLVDDVDAIDEVDEHLIVTNHKFARHFREWAGKRTAAKPVRIIDDGTTGNDNRLGGVRDLLLALDACHVSDDIMVLAADNILDFSLQLFVAFFRQKQTSVIMCYHEEDPVRRRRSGIIRTDVEGRVLQMWEKPQDPPTDLAVPPFYIYRKEDLEFVRGSVAGGCPPDAPGNLVGYLADKTTLHAWPMAGHRFDIGSLDSYQQAQQRFG